MLLEHVTSNVVKMNINFVDESVGSLLHYAVLIGNFDSRLETSTSYNSSFLIVSSLVSLKECEINVVNHLGQTPLHLCKNVEVAKILLDKGASMSIKECTGKQPLFTCICSARYDMCIEMLRRGCDLENVDRLGNTLFTALLHNGNAPFKLIWLLFEAGLAIGPKSDWLHQNHYPNKK